jgi:hypothetical protein
MHLLLVDRWHYGRFDLPDGSGLKLRPSVHFHYSSLITTRPSLRSLCSVLMKNLYGEIGGIDIMTGFMWLLYCALRFRPQVELVGTTPIPIDVLSRF